MNIIKQNKVTRHKYLHLHQVKKNSLIVEIKCQGLLNKTAQQNIATRGKILLKYLIDEAVNTSIHPKENSCKFDS